MFHVLHALLPGERFAAPRSAPFPSRLFVLPHLGERWVVHRTARFSPVHAIGSASLAPYSISRGRKRGDDLSHFGSTFWEDFVTAMLLNSASTIPFRQTAVATAAPVETDDMLVARILDGDTAAFTTLVERYKRPVYALAYRLLGNATDAEDAAQETFVRAYTRLTSYQTGSRFGSWLLAITSHWCIDSLRRKRALSLEAASEGRGDLGTPASSDDQPENVALDRERQHEVRAWLDQLPAPYRMILELRYWQDLSYNEISETTGLPVSTVRMRLFRARQLLSNQRGTATLSL